jgi:hypothetical protein
MEGGRATERETGSSHAEWLRSPPSVTQQKNKGKNEQGMVKNRRGRGWYGEEWERWRIGEV